MFIVSRFSERKYLKESYTDGRSPPKNSFRFTDIYVAG